MIIQDASSIPRLSAHALNYSPPPSSPHLGIYDTNPLEIDTDGFLQSTQRAGGPYLCSLPTDSIYPSPDSTLKGEEDAIKNHVIQILTEEGIDNPHIDLFDRASKVTPEETPVPTVLITVQQSDSSKTWRNAAKRIFNECLARYNPQASVEIISSALSNSPLPFPIEPTDGIFHVWPQVRDTILNELDITEWTGLECWRYGHHRHQEHSDLNPPTIIISIKLDSVRQFDADMQKIVQILIQNEVTDCAVLFMKDEFRRYSYTHHLAPLARLEGFSHQVQPGMSIGIHDDTATSATLGGVVEIQMEGDSSWRRFNLACFHSVYPDLPGQQEKLDEIPGARESLERWRWNAPGFEDSLVRKVLRVDQPSLFDVQDAIKRAGHDETKRTELQGFVDDKSYYLGEVCAGSGLWRTRTRDIHNETNKPGLLDWALIDVVKERQGPNTPYLSTSETPPTLSKTSNPPLPHGTELQNTGRKIPCTSTEHSPLVQVPISQARDTEGNTVPRPTYEHGMGVYPRSYLGGGGSSLPPFAKPGDAGSFVVDADGCVVGMLIGGFVCKETVYYTRIKNLLDDVREVTGAGNVQLALE
ncbi:hypothetical protein BO78DRAFT_422245 [Aspergillus sclerotiicarbonarius CBS 121057]|uniref:Uncharacterized protein n=1 Tax=Aspergillus sclerotiicarbonarius (strain CBS 121057 / IBT 28362) TaxID=1448318 RepID=A0A319EGG5_ASPSB|nr:hypothetical protein BO78DRAFT_422245 [Aspergillus sclerotiicarbonarius CBS 121057]